MQVWASLTQGSYTPLKLRWTWQPLSLSLRFSPSWLPLSLLTPPPRRGVGWTRITTWTLYILSIQGRLTLHVRILVHISQVSGVFLKSQCQCSCTDTLTKLSIPCRYGNDYKQCWRYILMYSFNNRFFDRLSAFLCGKIGYRRFLVRGCYCVSKNVLSHCVASRILCGKIVAKRFQAEVVITRF